MSQEASHETVMRGSPPLKKSLRKAPPVILVHGIGSDGSWADKLKPTLRPFMSPIVPKYPHFRRLGWLKVIVDPWTLIIGALTIGALRWNLALSNWTVLGLAVTAIVCAYLVGSIRRRRARNAILRRIKDSFRRDPCVIAHSFGTYLVARIATEIKGARFKRIVLVGSVLSRRWDWGPLASALNLTGVRNEWSNADSVALLGRVAGWLVRHVGDLGHKGFHHTLDKVHRIVGPNVVCQECRVHGEGLVHDVDMSSQGHSDPWLTPHHTERYWLPYLWGIDPAEYDALRGKCREFLEAEDKLEVPKLKTLEEDLRFRLTWAWLDGETLWQRIETILRERNRANPVDSAIALAIRSFCIAFALAAEAGCTEQAYFNRHPWSALAYALTS